LRTTLTKSLLERWINEQSLLRLRGILFSATEQGEYRFFLSHFPVPTHNMAHLMKEIMNRCRTPIYFTGHGYSQREIAYAWSLYWNEGLRVRVGLLAERPARELLEACIRIQSKPRPNMRSCSGSIAPHKSVLWEITTIHFIYESQQCMNTCD
jgi:hypothetical protein